MADSNTQMAKELNPRTTRYEFLGPPGALAITIGVPLTMYLLYYGCSEETGGCPPAVNSDAIVESLTSWSWWKGLWDSEAAMLYLAWYAYLVAAWYVLPGKWVEGLTTRNGLKKRYKINAFSTFIVTLGLVAVILVIKGPQSGMVIYDKWIPLGYEPCDGGVHTADLVTAHEEPFISAD